MLLHGLASQRRFWNLVATRLTGLPVLALDQRGHGDSDRPDSSYDGSTCASDLAVAMDALGWSRAVVVGHSWGGSVAATFAAEHPERTIALVAIDGGFAGISASTPEERADRRRMLEPPRWAVPPDELTATISQHAPGGSWTPDVAAAVLPIFEVGDDGLARARLPFELHMRIVDTLLDYDAAAVLARVRCAAWLVSCEAIAAGDAWSEAKSAALDGLRNVVANPRILRWGGAVHDVPLQWPDLVAGLLRTVVDEAAGATGAAGRSEA
ncbi:MAG: non-heme chloroperoxidase [Frankiaceae bacterium]|nr:non-heme chloroperoxidase [Frankiaceae bacterium]